MLLKLAWRNLWRNQRRTLISISAIGFALTLGVFFFAWGEGMYAQMIDNAVRMQAGHFSLEQRDYRDDPDIARAVGNLSALRKSLDADPAVRATKAVILGQSVVRSATGSLGVAVMGIDAAQERATSPLAQRLVGGHYFTDDGGLRQVVIGKGLAERLKVELGKKLVLTVNNRHGELAEELVRVVGIYALGSTEVDTYLVQIPLDMARKLYGLGADEATQLGVLVHEPEEREAVLARTRALLAGSDTVARPWEEVLPELAAYVKMDRGSNQVFQAIIIFLSLFTIFNTILMSILERTREFATVMALGSTPGRLRWQVLVETAMLAGIGCVVGLSLGGALSLYLQVYGFDMSSLYSSELSISGFAIDARVYAKLTPWIFVGFGGGTFLATVLISLIPMRRISRIDVAGILR